MAIRTKSIAKALLLSGIFILLLVLFPIIFSIFRFSFFSPPRLIDPTQVSSTKYPIVVNPLGFTAVDYSQPQVWFDPASLPENSGPTNVAHYTLFYPRLNMQNVQVEIDGTDLKKTPVHYPGTALPGSLGNTVIFGHSSLPYFYKPNNPLTIFNPLTKAKVGDEIYIDYDGISYVYRVIRIYEVNPSRVEVLSQSKNTRELTLITCVPLGTYWRRLIVQAQMLTDKKL